MAAYGSEASNIVSKKFCLVVKTRESGADQRQAFCMAVGALPAR
jgi:hypothetical protein